MSESYQVKRYPHGIAIIGPIPIREVTRLMKGWAKDGYDICDCLIAGKLGASMVVTTKEGSTAWRKELGL